MREGWLLSEGEVVASAIEDRSWASALSPVRGAQLLESALLVRALPVLVAVQPHDRLCIGHLAANVVVKVRPLRAWRPILRPRSATAAVIAPVDVFERAGIREGRQLEFRATR